MFSVLAKKEFSITQKIRWLRIFVRAGYDQRFNSIIGMIYDLIPSKTPIIVDRGTNVILDGHHRFAAADKLGLGLIPAILVDYPDSEISVSSWRSGIEIGSDDVIKAGVSGRLLPSKTSTLT